MITKEQIKQWREVAEGMDPKLVRIALFTEFFGTPSLLDFTKAACMNFTALLDDLEMLHERMDFEVAQNELLREQRREVNLANAELICRLDRYREALEFYADTKNYKYGSQSEACCDSGNIAKAALNIK
jgi:hypothetical protein